MNPAGGLTAGWDEVVVVVDVRRWDGRPSTASRLATVLADHVPVLLVVPVTVADRPQRADRSTLVNPRLARVIAPVLDLGRGTLGPLVDAALVRRAVRGALGELGDPWVRAAVVTPCTRGAGPVDADLRVLVVGDDVLDGWSLPGRSRALDQDLVRAVDDADLVVVGSPAIGDALAGLDAEPLILPDGVDDAAFADGAFLGSPPRIVGGVAGYVGDLAADVDLAALDAVARAGHELLLVGRGPRETVPPDLAALLRRSNVTWAGPRPPHEVRRLVATCGVGLVPLLDTAYTRARLPLDALVHLAAGHPLVTTGCEPARWLRAGLPDDDDVVIADDAQSFASLVGHRVGEALDLTAADRRRRFAEGHRWSARGDALADAIGVRDLAAVGAR